MRKYFYFIFVLNETHFEDHLQYSRNFHNTRNETYKPSLVLASLADKQFGRRRFKNFLSYRILSYSHTAKTGELKEMQQTESYLLPTI
jgi:alpha-D-ribose 1-methylphosphonate 5-triphosphate diphosphatase PhnM